MSKNQQDMKYRADIDGLRALAVFLVVLFHYDFPLFSGGYSGVDVFFVISGYLISGVIGNALANGNFSYKEFLLRRIRRLLPSYLVVVFAAFIASSIMFVPEHLKATALHVPAALFYVSNFLFIGEIDYFGVSNIFKPLMHTWSLSIEGQFYVIWSIAILFSHRYKKLGVVLLALMFLISIAGAIAFSNSTSSYFFTPFRIYEFMFGYAVYLLSSGDRPVRQTLDGMLVALGLLILVHTAVVFDDKTPFPSFYAVYPCMGAAMVLLGGKGIVGNGLLGNNIISYVGRISYAIFLIHWPIYVFYNYSTWGGVSVTAKIVLIAITVLLSSLLYHFVEQPIRRNLTFRSGRLNFSHLGTKYITASSLVVGLLLLPASALYVWHNDSAGLLYDATWSAEINAEIRDSNKKSGQFIRQHDVPSADAHRPGTKRVLVVGDSHSIDVFSALQLNADQFPNFYFRSFHIEKQCFEHGALRESLAAIVFKIDLGTGASIDCESTRLDLLNDAYAQSADFILITHNWPEKYLPYFEGAVSFYRQHFSGKIIVWGANRLPFDITALAIASGSKARLNDIVYNQDRTRDRSIDLKLRDMASQAGVEYFTFLDKLCSDETRKCDVVNDDGKLLYRDDNHWTFVGQKYFGMKMLDIFSND
jgi:peptidoglycan/LPS O-acetylase OafA/YrhL